MPALQLSYTHPAGNNNARSCARCVACSFRMSSKWEATQKSGSRRLCRPCVRRPSCACRADSAARWRYIAVQQYTSQSGPCASASASALDASAAGRQQQQFVSEMHGLNISIPKYKQQFVSEVHGLNISNPKYKHLRKRLPTDCWECEVDLY